MTMKPEVTHPDNGLDALFAEARNEPLAADPAFLARVLADADAVQPVARPLAPARRRSGPLARLAAALGGALMVAGIGSAAMAGLVIGYVQPEPMLSFAEDIGFAQVETLELMPSYDLLLDVEISE